MSSGIWSSQVNLFLSLFFVGSFALGAGLILWHAAYDSNPVANIMAASMVADLNN